MFPDPKHNPIQTIESDGVQRTIQIVGLSDSYGTGLRSNGKNAGTLFGDDVRTTRRVPVSSGRYNQGLPLFAVNYDIVGTGYWKIVEDGGLLNGASEFGTGIDANGKIYVSSKGLNRYEAGQLAYYLFTAAWNGISSANGNFVALVGASLPGLTSDGQDGDIKEGYMFGWVRDNDGLRAVVRTYKRFGYTELTTGLITPLATENMSIYQLEAGYLGIHPTLLYRIDAEALSQNLLSKTEYLTSVTSVDDPNLAISVYLENQGNTSNINIRNGSFQYGNYAERLSPDASSRRWLDTYSLGGVSPATDTVIALYQVPEKVTMYKELNVSTQLTGLFRNTLTNRLNVVDAVATSTANKPISLNVYLIPKSDLVDTVFTPVNQYINILERAVGEDIGTPPTLENASKIVNLPDIRNDHFRDVQKYNHLLTTNLVGVVTVSSSNTISDLEFTLNTEDLF